MELMRASWTDERLDDLKDEVVRQGTRIDGLSERVDGLSERIDVQTDRLENRINAQSDRIDVMSGRIDAISDRVEGLSQTILTIGGRIFAGCIAITVAIIGVIATQL